MLCAENSFFKFIFCFCFWFVCWGLLMLKWNIHRSGRHYFSSRHKKLQNLVMFFSKVMFIEFYWMFNKYTFYSCSSISVWNYALFEDFFGKVDFRGEKERKKDFSFASSSQNNQRWADVNPGARVFFQVSTWEQQPKTLGHLLRFRRPKQGAEWERSSWGMN